MGWTIRHYSIKYRVPRLFVSGWGGGVFPDMSGIRKFLVDFSGIVGFGLRNREVFWNKSCGISAELGRIHVRNSVENPFFSSRRLRRQNFTLICLMQYRSME